jgi:hypothetical protein
MVSRLLSFVAACMLLAALVACGTPGAPQLPSLNLARPVEDLTASRKGNKVELDWTLPKKNTDRTLVQLKHLGPTRICRHPGNGLAATCTEVGTVAPPSRDVAKAESDQSLRMKFVDTLPEQLEQQDPTGVLMYAVEITNTNRRSAGLSNQVSIPAAPTIAAPENLRVEVGSDGVQLHWSEARVPAAPPGLSYLYRVERRPAGAPGYIVLNDVEPPAYTYLDKTFEWEKKYEYRISTMTRIQTKAINAEVAGPESPPVEVFTKDIYPPVQPSGLQAVFSSVGQKPFIDLTWAPNLDSDLAGYNVFRRSGGEPPEKVNQKLIAVPSFRDEKVTPGTTYMYSVSAVDLRGNESPRSQETSEAAAANQ